MEKTFIPCIYLKNETAVRGFNNDTPIDGGDPVLLATLLEENGADELLVFDLSETDAEHDKAIGMLRRICDVAEIPVIGAGNVRRMEDVKKILYAGCKSAVLNFRKESNRQLLDEVSHKFAPGKMIVYLPDPETAEQEQEQLKTLAGRILVDQGMESSAAKLIGLPVLVYVDGERQEDGSLSLQALQTEGVQGVTGPLFSATDLDYMAMKLQGRALGLSVKMLESALPWSEFKTDDKGLVPCIVQDYRSDEVLMLAYMNEESYQTTLNTGRMTYWSRSRKELWQKGLTSGHFQFVKSISIDCDNDTMLARVDQIGAACHTGHRSCFYRDLVKKDYEEKNPLRIFENVFDVIKDRKVHPKEGSYTNYLFDKGIDKILKKVGEECTEIVIAAKNPDKEEIKYEISDFLYHVMVLMAEKDVTWEEITRELARR